MPMLSEIKMIDGTASEASYAIFAAKGTEVLAVRPLGLLPGASFGASDKTYLAARIRAAEVPKGYLPDDGIASLGTGQSHAELWPHIEFEKSDGSRASTIFGAFIRGTMTSDTEAMFARLEEGDFVTKLAQSVWALAGDNAVVREGLLVSWMQEQLFQPIQQMKSAWEAQNQFNQFADDNVENFGFQGKKLQDMFAKIQKDNGLGNPLDGEASHDTPESIGTGDNVAAFPALSKLQKKSGDKDSPIDFQNTDDDDDEDGSTPA